MVPFLSAGSFRIRSLVLAQRSTDSFVSLVENSPESFLHPFDSIVSLTDSLFHDFQIQPSEATFVSAGYSHLQLVSNCNFVNVTNAKQTHGPSPPFTIADDCQFDSNVVDSSEDIFYGRFVTGSTYKTLSSFKCTNSTFSRITRTHQKFSRPTVESLRSNERFADGDYTLRFLKKVDSESNQDQEFYNCKFHNINNDTDAFGNALYIKGFTPGWHGKWRMEKVSFTDCHTVNNYQALGGAVYGCDFKTVEHQDVNYTRCSVYSGDHSQSWGSEGGAVYVTNLGTFNIHKCHFTDCTGGIRGGGISLNNIPGENAQTDASEFLTECSFTNCASTRVSSSDVKRKGCGGGIYIYPNAAMIIKDTEFSSCTAGYAGGGVYYKFCGDLSKERLVGCTFKDNSASYGADAFFETTGTLTGLVYKDCTTTTVAEHRITVLTTTTCGGDGTMEDQNGWVPLTGEVDFYINTSAGSDATCTDQEKTKCTALGQTFNTALALAKDNQIGTSEFPMRIIILKTAHSQSWDCGNSGAYYYVVNGSSVGTVLSLTSSTSNNPLLTIDGGNVQFDGFTISLTESLNLGNQGLFKATKGTLKLASMIIQATSTDITAQQCHVVVDSDSSLICTSTQFSSLTRSTAGPAAIDASVSANLDLSGVTITACGSNANGKIGGGVKLTLNKAGLTILYPTFNDASFTKQKCALIFEAASIELLTSTDTTKGYDLGTVFSISEYSSALETKYYASITSSPAFSGPLLHLILRPSSNAALTTFPVSAAGFDPATYPTCGWEDLPCATLSGSLSYATKDNDKVTLTQGSYDSDSMSGTVNVDATVTIEGAGKESTTASLTSVDCFTITNALTGAKTVTITKMGFTTTASGFLSSAGAGTVILDTISIVGNGINTELTGSKTFIAATAGTLKLVDVSLSSIKIRQSFTLIDTKSTAKLVLNKAVFSEISIAGLPLLNVQDNVQDAIKFETTASTFTTIKRSDVGAGAVLSFAAPALDLSLATFTDCGTSGSGIGAAVKVEVSAANKITVTGETFKRTNNAWSDGKMSGLWVVAADTVISSDNTIKGLVDSVTDWNTYEKNHLCTIGTHTAPLIHAYKSMITKNNKNTEAFSVLSTGAQVDGCGWSDLPCKSLSKPINSIGTTAGQSITVGPSTTIDDTCSTIKSSLTITSVSTSKVAVTASLANDLFTVGDGTSTVNVQVSGLIVELQAAISHSIFTITSYTTKSKLSLTAVTIKSKDTSQITCSDQPVINAADGKLVLQAFVCQYITMSGSSLLTVGVEPEELEFKDDTQKNTFKSIYRSDAGSAQGVVFSLTLESATSKASLHHIKFEDCKFSNTDSTKRGGIIYLAITDASATVDITSVTFPSTSGATSRSNAEEGKYIFVDCTEAWLGNDATPEAHAESLLTIIDHKRDTPDGYYQFQRTTGDNKTVYEFTDLLPELTDYYVATDAKGTGSCLETKANACTMETAYGAIKELSHDKACGIKLVGSTDFHKAFTLNVPLSITYCDDQNSDKLEVKDLDPSPTLTIGAVKITCTVLIVSLTASLTQPVFKLSEDESNLVLDRVQFTISAGNPTFSKSLVDASSGFLTLDGTSFTDIAMGNTALIACTPELTIKHSASFSGVTRSDAGGAVFHMDVDDDTLDLREASFSNCGSTSGTGAAVYLNIKVASPTFYIQHTEFESNRDENYGLIVEGAKAALLTENLATFAQYVYTDNSWSAPAETKHQAVYKAADGTTIATVPLCYIFYAPTDKDSSEQVYVDPSSKVDLSTCGWSLLPCKTVTAALDLDTPAEKVTLVAGSVPLTEDNAQLDIKSEVEITGQGIEGTTTTVPITGLSSDTRAAAVNIKQGSGAFTVTFKQVILSIASAQGAILSKPAFFIEGEGVSTKATLAFETVSILPSGTTVPMTASLINTKNGILSFTSTTISNIALQNSPLLSISSVASAFVCNDGLVFSGITREEGNGAVLEESLASDSHLVLKASVKGCSSKTGFSVMHFTLYEDTASDALTFTEMTYLDSADKTISAWTGSDAGHSAPLGFYAAKSAHFTPAAGKSTINLKTLAVDYNNAATCLHKYYAQATATGWIVPLKYYLDNPEGDTFYIDQNGVDGENVPTCGSEQLPCNAVKDAYKHIPDNTGKTICLGDGDGYINKQVRVALLLSVNLKPKPNEEVTCVITSLTDGALIAVAPTIKETVTVGLSDLKFVPSDKNNNGFDGCLISVISASITLTNCFITSTPLDLSSSFITLRANAAEEQCSWNGEQSVFQFTDSATVTIDGTRFANMTDGAIKLSNCAKVNLINPIFETNRPSQNDFVSKYPSFSKNVLCESTSAVTVTADASNKDILNTLWILSDGCTFAGDIKNANQAFFIPTLSDAKDTVDLNAKSVKIVYTGERFIPCNLNYVLMVGDKEQLKKSIPTTYSETTFTVTITGDAYTAYDEGTDVRTYLAYGPEDQQDTTAAISLKRGGSEAAKKSESGFPTYAVVIIAVVGLLLLLLLLLILICCCCCRKKEEDEEGQEELIVAKDDTDTLKTEPLAPTVPTAGVNTSLMVEGIEVKAPHARVLADVKNSLFSRIHRESERQTRNPFAWAAGVGTDFADGVTYILNKIYGPSGRKPKGGYPEPAGKDELSYENLEKLLNSFSPHALLFTEDGEMTLSVVPPTVYLFIFPDSEDTDTFQNEVRRYQAPEATRRESARTRAEAESAAVYSLGLLLYEVFTGWVPFNGYSANEASEMMCNGMRPDTAQISQVDSSFSDLIGTCVAQEWTERPPLSEVKKKLSLYLPASAREHFEGMDSDADSKSF